MFDHPVMHFMFDFSIAMIFLAYGVKFAGLALLDLWKEIRNFKEGREQELWEPKDIDPGLSIRGR